MQLSLLLLVVQYDIHGFHTKVSDRRVLRTGGHERLRGMVERLRGADQTTDHDDDSFDRGRGNISSHANQWDDDILVGLLEHADCYGNDCGKRQYA